MRCIPVVPLVFVLVSVVELALAEGPLTRSLPAPTQSELSKPDRNSTDASKESGNGKLAPMLVKLTPVQTDPEHSRLSAALDSASHAAIAGIPGITVLSDNDDEMAVAKKSRKPVVVLSGKLQNIGTSKQGDEVEFRAQIQYVIYRIPGRDIAAVVDGTARTRISAVQVKSKESRQQVEDDVAAAAVESAARRAPAALLAVSKK